MTKTTAYATAGAATHLVIITKTGDQVTDIQAACGAKGQNPWYIVPGARTGNCLRCARY